DADRRTGQCLDDRPGEERVAGRVGREGRARRLLAEEEPADLHAEGVAAIEPQPAVDVEPVERAVVEVLVAEQYGRARGVDVAAADQRSGGHKGRSERAVLHPARAVAAAEPDLFVRPA